MRFPNVGTWPNLDGTRVCVVSNQPFCTWQLLGFCFWAYVWELKICSFKRPLKLWSLLLIFQGVFSVQCGSYSYLLSIIHRFDKYTFHDFVQIKWVSHPVSTTRDLRLRRLKLGLPPFLSGEQHCGFCFLFFPPLLAIKHSNIYYVQNLSESGCTFSS